MLRKFFLTGLLTLLCIISIHGSAPEVPNVEKGTIDISQWDFQNNYLYLNGEWEFYWDTLLTPASNFDSVSKYIIVPAAWSSKKAGRFPVKGFATYRLKILSGSLEGTYGILLHDLFTASNVWFDGKLIYSTGQTGVTKKTSIPAFLYKEIPVFFEKNKPEHELVVQVSNFHHTRSGLVKPIKFGHFDTLANKSKNNLILNLFIVGIIFFIGLSHLLNYFLYKNQVTHLFFGLLCLVMILRNVSTGQRVITYIFPNINWQLLFKLDNFSGFGTIPLFAIFLFILYKKDFPRVFLNIFITIGILITLFVSFTPQIVYGRYRMFFELYILVGGLFLTFYVLLRASIKKREGAMLTFMGFFILYATAINDVLISMGLANSLEVAPFGLVTYMLIQSFVLSRGSAMAFEENKKLGLAIQKEKQMLEKRVAERTHELEIRNREIVKQQEELKNQLWLNESLARINHILNKNSKDNVHVLSKLLLDEILHLTSAKIGVMYVAEGRNGGSVLELVAAKNASKEIMSKKTIEPGEGLVGTCFQRMELMRVENISDTYLKLDSGLGETRLSNLVFIPLFTNNIPVGVIELATFKPLPDKFTFLLENISESISATIRFIKMNIQNVQLLEEFREKNIQNQNIEFEVQQKEQELRALREEMELLKSKN
ncbi:MAG: GAF domain-containing protein [Bacteroidales bacterium]|nr:GAF domain-containing protein [Bacteroidales bacterium]